MSSLNQNKKKQKQYSLIVFVVSAMTCPKGLVYRQCRDKLDDFCLKGFDNALTFSCDICFSLSGIENVSAVKTSIFTSSHLVWLYRIVKEGAPFKCTREGCFCPHGQIKADQDSNICVTSCPCE